MDAMEDDARSTAHVRVRDGSNVNKMGILETSILKKLLESIRES